MAAVDADPHSHRGDGDLIDEAKASDTPVVEVHILPGEGPLLDGLSR